MLTEHQQTPLRMGGEEGARAELALPGNAVVPAEPHPTRERAWTCPDRVPDIPGRHTPELWEFPRQLASLC